VLGIFALEFLFQSRVVFAPETGEVLGNLDGAHVWREDVDENRNAAHSDFGCGVDVVEFLDAQGDVRRIAQFIGNFWRFAVGKVEAFRGMFVEQVLLGGTEPGLENGFDGFVFDVFISECAVANLFDEMAAVFIVDGWQREFRAPLAEEIESENPLFGGMIPVVQNEPASDDFFGEEFCCRICGRRIGAARADYEIAEAKLFFGINAFRGGVIKNAWRAGDVFGEKFLQPFLFDDRGEAEDGVDGFVFSFDLADFGDDEEGAVVNDTFASERAAAAMDQLATKCARIDAASDAIAETDEDAFVEGFILNFARGSFETFAFGDIEELLEKGTNLSSSDGMDAESPAGINAILIPRGVGPGAHEDPEIAAGFIAEEIFAVAGGGFVDVAEKKVAALGESGDKAGLVNAAVVLRCEKHSGVARVEGEGEHFAAGGGDGGCVLRVACCLRRNARILIRF